MDFVQFLDNHYVAACYIATLLTFLLVVILWFMYKLISKQIRRMTIDESGWPPPHLDVDGNYVARDPLQFNEKEE